LVLRRWETGERLRLGGERAGGFRSGEEDRCGRVGLAKLVWAAAAGEPLKLAAAREPLGVVTTGDEGREVGDGTGRSLRMGLELLVEDSHGSSGTGFNSEGA
jgi:hypothetical protein